MQSIIRIHGAYIPARYSTDNQNPDSIEVQIEKCTQWCEQNQIPVLDVFPDYAISGMKDTRPQFERMMQCLRAPNSADTVVIYDQSRMFRDMTEWFSFRKEMEAIGVRVVSVTQPFVGGDLSDPSVFMTEGAMALFNQMWVLQTRQKVKSKMEFMARNGQFTGGRAYYGIKIENQRRVICEEEAQVVVRIFRRKAQRQSYRQIRDELEADGILNRSGKPFGVNEIHDILYREEYLGRLIYGKTRRSPYGRKENRREDMIIIENALPAIIWQELWDDAHAQMRSAQRTGGRKYKEDFHLKGKVFCGSCGGAMELTYSKNQQYAYYRCGRKHRDGTCNGQHIKAEMLEQVVVDAVVSKLGSPDNREQLLAILREHRGKVQSGVGVRLPQLEAQMSDTRKKLDNATDAILQGLTSQSLIDKIKALESHLEGLRYQIQSIKMQMDTVDIDDSTLSNLLDTITAEKPAAAVLTIVSRVEVHDDTIKIWTILDNVPPDGPKGKTDVELPVVDESTNNCSVRLSGTRTVAVIGIIVNYCNSFFVSGGANIDYAMALVIPRSFRLLTEFLGRTSHTSI